MKRIYLAPDCTIMQLTSLTVLLGSRRQPTIEFNSEPVPSGGGGD